MVTSMAAALATIGGEGDEPVRELPMEPLAFGLSALGLLLLLLAVTWAFRGISNRH